MFEFIRLQFVMGKIGKDEVIGFCAKGLITKKERDAILPEIGE